MSHSGDKKTTRVGESPSADILERLIIRNRYDGDITGHKFVAKGTRFLIAGNKNC